MLFGRHHPPAHSPLHLRALAQGTSALLRPGRDPRPELAERLAVRYSADRVQLCGSGTQALQLAIEEACRRQNGADLIALPAFGCYDLATAAVGARVRVSLYDVEPRTLAPDPESLEHVLRRGARIVVVAPFYGLPVDWEVVQALGERYGATMIEDAAQGHGAFWRDRPLGSLGEISVISFGRGKGWTGGNGGALMIRGDAGHAPGPSSAHRIADARTLAAAAAQWLLARPRLYSVPASLPWLHLGATIYHEPVQPRAMGAVAAAIILAAERAADSEAGARRANTAALIPAVPAPMYALRPPPGSIGGYLRLPVRLDDAALAMIAALELRGLGVAATYPTTLAALPQIGERLAVQAQEDFRGAETVVREIFTLPAHGFHTPAERAQLLDGLRDLVRRAEMDAQ